MHVIVLNVDRQPQRWEQASERFGRFGVTPLRWPGVDAGADATRNARCRAICQSYEQLLATVTEPTLIVQDDVTLTHLPTLTGGLIAYNRPTGSHLCPKVFSVDGPWLAAAFTGQWRACQILTRQPVRYGESCL